MMKIKLKTVLRIVLRTCKTVSINPCISREDNSKITQCSYKSIVVTKTMKFLAIVTPLSIYQILYSQVKRLFFL